MYKISSFEVHPPYLESAFPAYLNVFDLERDFKITTATVRQLQSMLTRVKKKTHPNV